MSMYYPLLPNSTFWRKCSTRSGSRQIQTKSNRHLVVEYYLINEMASVTPMPKAHAIKFLLSMARELNGLRNGPTTNTGFMSFWVQFPHLWMHMEKWLCLLLGKTVKAWNWYFDSHGSIRYTYAEFCFPNPGGFSKEMMQLVSPSRWKWQDSTKRDRNSGAMIGKRRWDAGERDSCHEIIIVFVLRSKHGSLSLHRWGCRSGISGDGEGSLGGRCIQGRGCAGEGYWYDSEWLSGR